MTVEQIDAILREVTRRSTVYAREILEPLCDVRGSEATACLLESLSSECNGDTYLHVRDFLNPLLDLRNTLAKEEA